MSPFPDDDGLTACKGVLIYTMRDATHEERAQAIYDMRVQVKKAHKDVRTNQAVISTMWEIIEDVNELEDSAIRQTPKRKRGRPRKSQAKGDSSDSDEEYNPTKRRS